MEVKFGPTENRYKMIDISRDVILWRKSWVQLSFDHKMHGEILDELKLEKLGEKLSR
jgi:hypothetical protein